MKWLLQVWSIVEIFRHVRISIFDLEFCPSSAAEGKTRLHFSSHSPHTKLCLSSIINHHLYLYIQHSRRQHILARANSSDGSGHGRLIFFVWWDFAWPHLDLPPAEIDHMPLQMRHPSPRGLNVAVSACIERLCHVGYCCVCAVIRSGALPCPNLTMPVITLRKLGIHSDAFL